MITQVATTRREVITPATPSERRFFTRVDVGPGGATIQLGSGMDPSVPALTIATSAEAAVLEELGRMIRVRLQEQELAGVARPQTTPARPASAR